MPFNTPVPELSPSASGAQPSLSHVKKQLNHSFQQGRQALQRWLIIQPPAEPLTARLLTHGEGHSVWEVRDTSTQEIKLFYTESEARAWCEQHYLR